MMGDPGSCVVDSSQAGIPDGNLEVRGGKGSPFSGGTAARLLAPLLPALYLLLDPWAPKWSSAESSRRPLQDSNVGELQCEAGALN